MRRLLALVLLVVLAPAASAASQVHVTYLGERYAVTFVSNATTPTVPVTFGDERSTATLVPLSTGDDDRVYRALLPARELSYSVEGRSFSLPAPPAKDATTRIAYVADMGTDANASAILAAMVRAKPDLVVIGGDLSYANGKPAIWNEWFDLMQPLAANVPMMPAYGNHEDYCEEPDFSLHHCGPEPNGWHAHFALPNGEKLYYAFDWGPVRFTVLDTEAYESGEPFTDADEQEEYLNSSLDEADGRWNVVTYHRPLRTTNAREGLASDGARVALEPLLAGRADLVLQAHLHAYERSKPENGTVFVTSGGGGRALYGNWSAEEPWVAKRAAEFHFLLIEASPTAIDVHALRPDGSTLDRFTLERAAPPKLTPTPTATAASTPTRGPAPTPPNATAPATVTEGNATVGSNETPAPAALALLVVLTLSGRLTRGRASRAGR